MIESGVDPHTDITDAERPGTERQWEVGYEGHELAQLRRLAAMPFHLKLQWLEEAHRTLLAMRGEAPEQDLSGVNPPA